jgi:hypothetical protein
LLDLPVGWSLIGPVGLPDFAPLAVPLTQEPAASVLLPLWWWDPNPALPSYVMLRQLACGQATWAYAVKACRVKLGP